MAGAAAPASNALERVRQHYLARLAAHLEAHKFYPDAARKRGLEGAVQIAFEVRAGGETGELQLSGGHKMLHQAAAETVRRAMPLPPPPKEVSMPLSVRYGMTFALQ
jgi:protein TonB